MNDHSQYGEASIVAAMFPPGFIGRVAEIGAWSPTDKSNSRGFIEAGWSALLCEMSPGPLRNLIVEYGHHPKVNIVASAIVVEPNDEASALKALLPRFQVTDDALTTNDAAVFNTWKDAGGGYFGSAYFATTTVRQLFVKFPQHYDVISIDAEGTSVELLAEAMAVRDPHAFIVEHDNQWDKIHALCSRHQYEVVPHPPSVGTNAILRRRG